MACSSHQGVGACPAARAHRKRRLITSFRQVQALAAWLLSASDGRAASRAPLPLPPPARAPYVRPVPPTPAGPPDPLPLPLLQTNIDPPRAPDHALTPQGWSSSGGITCQLMQMAFTIPCKGM